MLLAAAALLVVLALAHSLLAEWMIFRHAHHLSGLPLLGFPPTMGAPQPASHIVRACWHLLGVFGVAFAVLLARYGMRTSLGDDERFAVRTIGAALAAGGALIFLGTRAKHVGWVGFSAAAALCWLGAG
jgi:hypothetical protein